MEPSFYHVLQRGEKRPIKAIKFVQHTYCHFVTSVKSDAMKEIETSKIYTVFKLLTFLQLNNTSQLIFIHLTLCSKLTLEQFKVSQLCLVNTEKRES